MRNSQKVILSLLICSLVIVSADQFTQLSQVCSYYAKDKFGAEYSGDISKQRCSFCQYSKSQDGFAKGCATCPDYATGQCKACADGYVLSPQKICIPCPEGSNCCIGNTASSDPYFQSYTANTQNFSSLQMTYAGLNKFSGLRQTACKTGYFSLGHACVQIPDGCDSMSIQGTSYYCKACKAGYYFDSDNKCVQKCQALFTQTNGGQQQGNCATCSSENKCLSCGSQNGLYYYLETLPSVKEDVKNPVGFTRQTLQMCTQCPDNCIDCTRGSKTCNTCAPYYFVDKEACTLCNDPVDYVKVNADANIKQFYSACTSNEKSANVFKFTDSLPQQDVLGLSAPRPIIELKNGKRTACDATCVKCTKSQDIDDATVCTECMNGYYLDPKTNTCTKCPDHSVLCKYNTFLEAPQVLACEVNSNDLPPYSQTYYLQFNDVSIFKDKAAYKPNEQCVKNTNYCKEMISNDYSKVALCKSCYTSAADFGAGLFKPSVVFNPYVLTTGQTCRQCNSAAGFKTCEENPNDSKELIVKTCLPGYQPKPVGVSCKACDDKFATCDDDGKVLTCKPQYYTLLDANNKPTDCLVPYSTALQNQGCALWGSGQNKGDYPSCATCQTGYTKVVTSLTMADGTTVQTPTLCQACPDHCNTCSTDANRLSCLTCEAGYYLHNGVCSLLPEGCATFNGTKCTYCLYGYRLVNDQWCSRCLSGANTFTGGQFFDCPQANCTTGANDDPTTPTYSSILSVVSTLAFLVAALFI